MKWVLLTLLTTICLPLAAQSQPENTYAHFGASGYFSKGTDAKVGINGGVAFAMGPGFTAGPTFDIYPFDRDFRFAVGYIDFRPHFFKEDMGPYFCFRPGYVMYAKRLNIGNTVYKTSGSIAFDAMLGFVKFAKKNHPGFGASVGYGYISYKTKAGGTSVTTHTHGAKASLNLIF